jgi:hypothetical protein
VETFCLAFDIGRSTVYEEIRSGHLKAHKVGARTIIALEDGLAWLNGLPVVETDQTRNPSPPGAKQRSMPPTCVLIITIIAPAIDWWMNVAEETFVGQGFLGGFSFTQSVVSSFFI